MQDASCLLAHPWIVRGSQSARLELTDSSHRYPAPATPNEPLSLRTIIEPWVRMTTLPAVATQNTRGCSSEAQVT